MRKIQKIGVIILSLMLLLGLFTFSASALGMGEGTTEYVKYTDDNGKEYTLGFYLRTFNGKLAREVSYFKSSETGLHIEIPDYVLGRPVVALYDTFKNCDQIESVVFPSTMTDYYKFSFQNCTNLKSVKLSASITSIPAKCFSGCGNLETVIIPEGVERIEENAFISCRKLKNITLPSTMTYLGTWAFRDCKSLGEINIPAQTNMMGREPFRECENLKRVTFSEGLENIVGYAFYDCKSIESLYFPSSVKTIGGSAFAGCESVATIEFTEDSECTIYNRAFAGTAIKSITLPKGIRVSDLVFAGCDKLETAVLYCGVFQSESASRDDTGTSEGLFKGCSNLVSVELLSEDFGLGASMFSGCKSLERIHYKETILVTSVPKNAFRKCDKLERGNVNIDFSPVTTVERWAFDGCEKMRFDIQNDLPNLADIEAFGFRNCPLVYNLDLKNITNVGESAFENCVSIEEVVLPDGIEIGERAFAGCTGIKGNIVIPSDAVIGKQAFTGCTGIGKDIVIPDGSTIGDEAFVDCTGIESITFVGNQYFDKLGGDIFRNCTSVKLIRLEDGFNYDDDMHDLIQGVISANSMTGLERYEVGTNSMNVFTDNGVLYQLIENNGEQLLVLLSYPAARVGEEYSTANVMPEYTGSIAISERSFFKSKNLKKLVITQPVLTTEEYDKFRNGSSGYKWLLPEYAFENSSIEEVQTLGGNFDIIYMHMFKNSNIKTVDLSDATKLCPLAFCNCQNLENIALTNCQEIWANAFEGCTNLEIVILPKCQVIRGRSFARCSKLNLVYIILNDCKLNGSNIFEDSPMVSIMCDKESKAYEYAQKYNIRVVEIAVELINANKEYEYTGNEIRPATIIAIGETMLTENKDYVIYYENNTEITDSAKLTVHFIGDYEGICDIYREFSIVPRNISSANIQYVKDNVYDGEDIRPAVVVIIDGKELTEGTDYDIIYRSGADTGTMLFTVKGKGNYTGEIDCYYNIIRRDIAEAAAENIPDQIYTGEGVCPSVVIKWNGFTLTEGEDFEVRYFENVNAGYATAVIYGKGNFCGTLKIKYKIFGKDISNAQIESIPDMPYCGEELRPQVTVILDGKTLAEGTDYSLSYENNTESGTANVTVSGLGNYSGVIKKSFKIYKNSVNSFTVFSETQMTETFNGNALKPEMEVYFGTELLTEGVDYEIMLENNVSAGTATVTVIGIGRFEGERSYNFTILPLGITENNITVSGNMEYNGAPVTPEVTVTVNGTELENGKDYTVSYNNNNAVGTGYITVEGKGNYKNTVKLEYEIYSVPDPEEPEIPSDVPTAPADEIDNGSNGENTQDLPTEKPENTGNNETPDNAENTEPSGGLANGENAAPQIPNTDYTVPESGFFAVKLILALALLSLFPVPARKKRETK